MKAQDVVAKLRRHLEGWPLGFGVVGAAALTAVLAVPRPVEPDMLPVPQVDREQQQAELQIEQGRAARAKAGLPLEVRSVGEALRRLGKAGTETPGLAPQLSARLRRLGRVAIERHGPERLLELRALQAELFATAVLGADDAATRELAGAVHAAATERGWFQPPLDRRELEAFYRVFWTEMLGLIHTQPYAPMLNEWRVYYRFLLSRPLGEGAARRRDAQLELGYVAALARHDQDYPARLARGVLFYQQAAFADAAVELRAHLERHPDGAWTLRARNYLAACGAALVP